MLEVGAAVPGQEGESEGRQGEKQSHVSYDHPSQSSMRWELWWVHPLATGTSRTGRSGPSALEQPMGGRRGNGPAHLSPRSFFSHWSKSFPTRSGKTAGSRL